MIGTQIASPRSVLARRDALEHVHQAARPAAGTCPAPSASAPLSAIHRSKIPASSPVVGHTSDAARCRPVARSVRRLRDLCGGHTGRQPHHRVRAAARLPRRRDELQLVALLQVAGDVRRSAARPAPARSWSHRSPASHVVVAGRDQPVRRLSAALALALHGQHEQERRGDHEQAPHERRQRRSRTRSRRRTPATRR